MTELSSDIKETQKKSKSKNKIWVVIVIVLLACAAFFYFYAKDLMIAHQGSQLNQLQKYNDEQAEKSLQNRSDIQKLNLEVTTLQAALAQQNSILQQFSPAAGLNQKVMMLQAKHLAQLAYYNLIFYQDIPVAITLLQASDEQIAKVNDPGLLNLRQQLEKNISDLKSVPTIDIPGLLTRIQNLQTQVLQLSILIPTSKEKINPVDNSTLPAWRKAWENSVSSIQRLIVIRYTDKKISPILPAVQQAYLQQNLQLLLQQAQWAILRRQQTIYQNSLTQAKNLIAEHFVQDSALSKTMMNTFNDLLKVNVSPEIPNIVGTVQAISQAAENK